MQTQAVLLLALALAGANAFAPTALPLTATRRAVSPSSSLRMQQGPKINRRSALLFGGCSLGSLLLPAQEAAAKDLPVTVIGPSGGNLGSECVASLVREGVRVRAVTRSKKQLPIEDPNGLIEYVIADVTKPDTLPKALLNSRAVIFTATAGKQAGRKDAMDGTQSDLAGGRGELDESTDAVDYIGAANVASVCIKGKVPRFILVSSASCSESTTDICNSKSAGEQAVRDLYTQANDPAITYTIARVGQLVSGQRRGPAAVELNQGDDKNGFISRADMADLLAHLVKDKENAKAVTFEAFYSDSANPTNIVASVTKCVEGGKSMKECFFGDAYAGNKRVDLQEMLKESQETDGKVALPKGDAFKTGRENRGSSFAELVQSLSPDKEEPFDIFSLGLKSS
mmetsp:Transcript_31165/g.76455  ORF Transcript_31165/g.76455 Transcript_31165/m.76455 type:complete len:399 (+) Transcript_31165:72-1268(+)|eukprot:CAMPEP_0206229728 /NCGR_PEP_ID=MMETSP0047_2-20121206/9855_1 /ASSEMBLY_ACC=CAM_ASM_000192 /TAXON_ID=195065 /ORGANISM="Chroomonas mesostigmatica_cf, Strain CCMP1168" /LENGTH=398 /DNA_ID=CAMNT_0053653053 /DNA_START=52 /DNA_END=1248 /DNA_ORIENTATION=-